MVDVKDFIAVILAGGSGERFWPLSRKHKPKQFLTLEGQGCSLLQATAQRLLELTGGFERIFVVTSSEYRGQVFDQLPDLPSENLIVEPLSRGSTPAILYSPVHSAALSWRSDRCFRLGPPHCRTHCK